VIVVLVDSFLRMRDRCASLAIVRVKQEILPGFLLCGGMNYCSVLAQSNVRRCLVWCLLHFASMGVKCNKHHT